LPLASAQSEWEAIGRLWRLIVQINCLRGADYRSKVLTHVSIHAIQEGKRPCCLTPIQPKAYLVSDNVFLHIGAFGEDLREERIAGSIAQPLNA
jgi:hypothetical protein